MNKEQGLASGKVLLALKQRFLNDMSMETLMGLLHCMVDSYVILPMNQTMNNQDLAMFDGIDLREYIETSNTTMRPDLVKMEEELYLPIFTKEEELPKDYKIHFTLVKVKTMNLVKLVKDVDGLRGLLLDPFSEPFVIDDELLQSLEKIYQLQQLG